MKIIGIDPSIRSTGYGIIESDGRRLSAVAFGTIPNPVKRSPEASLLNIVERLRDVLREHRPEQAAIEKIIFVQSVRTAIIMGTARGAALVALAEAGLSVSEYPAKSVKMAATGRGGAQKQQVGFMMRVLLGLKTTPKPDEGDALAIALTHARSLAL
ncbi:MAG: crossover junction endodeoxyribonuclease RuvC [Verrucomicrobiales bacterium]|jgi:crossover junction endodeoxyribonuclease RuvC|nr:crossover junction endodeoxyribonuclease RuvC [Verrucomicrobiales bacterium]